MSRVYVYRNAMFLDYRRRAETWRNEHLDFRLWHIKEHWFVKFGIEKKWIGTESLHYEGHSYRSVTICGLEIGVGYSYDSRPLIDWTDEKI